MRSNRLRLSILEDYEGVLAAASPMAHLRELAAVTILDRPLEPADRPTPAECHVLTALREGTRLFP